MYGRELTHHYVDHSWCTDGIGDGRTEATTFARMTWMEIDEAEEEGWEVESIRAEAFEDPRVISFPAGVSHIKLCMARRDPSAV